MRICIVVAASEDGVIGRDGGIPWRLPDDQRFFKRLTTGGFVVMGRRTFESIGRPLPGRATIVVSRTLETAPRDTRLARDLEEALALARDEGAPEVFVAGGQAIYEQALPRGHQLYLTRVHARVEGDVRFPDVAGGAHGGWKLVEERAHAADDRHAHAFTFQRWERADGGDDDAPPRTLAELLD